MGEQTDRQTSDQSRLGARLRDWQALAYFSIYRVLLAGLMTGLGQWAVMPQLQMGADPHLFGRMSVVYLTLSLLALAACGMRKPGFANQVPLQVFVDIVALTVLMHASGGVASGLGLLLVVAIAGGSLLSGRRIAILFAAVATLAVLAEQTYASIIYPWISPNYPNAGVLGAAMFAAALLANYGARSMRASEVLAARQEEGLVELGRLNEHIVQRMQSGILVVEADGRVRLANKSACRLLGMSELSSEHTLMESLPTLAQVMKQWRQSSGPGTFLFEPGASNLTLQVSFAELTSDRGGAILFLEDHGAITQRAQQLKLAALGRLAGSIAHEIRNPLSAVTHANALLQESQTLAASDRRLMEIVDNNAQRMNDIVESVLSLGRRAPSDPRPLQVQAWLTEFASEMTSGAALDENQIEVTVEPTDLRIRADTTQLRQVLQNLCENALQHMESQEARIVLDAGLAPDSRRPYIDVRDNGPGIPASALDKLFEPFFTTRASGSGLGLYIARELCEANQATLNHRPTEGSGCCFRMTFADPRRRGLAAA